MQNVDTETEKIYDCNVELADSVLWRLPRDGFEFLQSRIRQCSNISGHLFISTKFHLVKLNVYQSRLAPLKVMRLFLPEENFRLILLLKQSEI